MRKFAIEGHIPAVNELRSLKLSRTQSDDLKRFLKLELRSFQAATKMLQLEETTVQKARVILDVLLKKIRLRDLVIVCELNQS